MALIQKIIIKFKIEKIQKLIKNLKLTIKTFPKKKEYPQLIIIQIVKMKKKHNLTAIIIAIEAELIPNKAITLIKNKVLLKIISRELFMDKILNINEKL